MGSSLAGVAFFDKPGWQMGFLKVLAAAHLIDRAFRGVNSAIEIINKNTMEFRLGMISSAEATERTVKDIAKLIPVLGQAFALGEALGKKLTGDEEQIAEANAILRERTIGRIDEELEQSRIDKAKGTAEGIELEYKKALKEIQQEFANFERDITRNRILNDNERADALRKAEETRQNKESTAAKERLKALKGLTGQSSFDTFNTVFGAAKVRNLGPGGATKPSTEDTAKKTEKNTKQTASLMQSLINKVGGNVAFA